MTRSLLSIFISLCFFLYFKNFLFITSYKQCDYHMPWCSLLYVSSVWDLLSFLHLWVSSFPQIWKNFGCYFFRYISCPLFVSWFLCSNYISLLDVVPQLTDVLFIVFSFFSSVSVFTDRWFQFINLFFCIQFIFSSSLFYISDILFFTSGSLIHNFFLPSMSLLNMLMLSFSFLERT